MANPESNRKPTETAAPAPEARPEPGAEPRSSRQNPGAALDLVMDVSVRISVELGSAKLRVREVLQFDEGSVLELDRAAGEPADVLVNGRLLARGEVTVVDDRLAVRVVEVVAGPGAPRGR